MRYVLICILVFSFFSGCTKPLNPPSGKITQFGIFKGEAGTLYKNTMDERGNHIHSFTGGQFVDGDKPISPSKGLRFGFYANFVDFPSSTPVELTYVIQHPPIRSRDGKIFTEDRWTHTWRTDKSGDLPGKSISFDFDEPNEMVSGTWLFQIYYGKKLLVEQSFETLLPK